MKTSENTQIAISSAVMSDDAPQLRTILQVRESWDADELGAWLALAASEDKVEAMQVLVSRGANLAWKNEDGESPFSFACANNHLNAAQFLFRNGVDVNAQLSDRITALDCAVCSASLELRAWLRSVGGVRTTNYPEWNPPLQSKQQEAEQVGAGDAEEAV